MTVASFVSILLVHLLASISPGPAFVVSARTAAAEGFGVSSAFALGVGFGSVAWALAAMLGLALLFQIAPTLLAGFKIAGGLLLLWIAFRTWRHADEPVAAAGVDQAPPRRTASAFRLGLITQIANPKSAVFFGAVFVGLVPAGTDWRVLALLLAAIFVDEVLWYVLVGGVFSTARIRDAYAGAKRWIDRGFGALIAALGLKIATT